MSYPSTVKLFCRFDNSLLLNEVTSTTGFSATPSGTAHLVPAVYNKGLQMCRGSYVSSSTSLSITNMFSIGFWLKPTNPGMCVDPNGNLIPLRMALLGRSTYSTNPTTGQITRVNAAFTFEETTQDDGTNKMEVFLNGSSSSATITSPSYAAGDWHHFWVTYNGTGTSVTMYIDGLQVTTSTVGSIPTTLQTSTSLLNANLGVDGYTYNTSQNVGIIDELVVLNVADATVLDRVINLGVDYAYNSSLTSVQEAYQAWVFDDPTTVQINSVLTNNSDIFVARSDGTLSKGMRENWQVNHGFGSPSEQELLQQQFGVDNTKYSISDGVLTVQTIVVRI